MKRTKLLLLLAMTPIMMFAAKAYTVPARIVQSDGTSVTVTMHGDENLNYATTSDGVILYQSGTDYYVAQISSVGEILPTNQLVHEAGSRSENETELIAKQKEMNFDSILAKQASSTMRKEAVIDNKSVPYLTHVGSPRVPVILVEFTDSVFSLDNPKQTFYKYLNATSFSSGDGTVSRNYGSVAQYFYDMSFGAFRPIFDVYGPVKLPNNLKYYGEGRSDYMSRFVPDACKAVDDSIDFSKYDSNNDGKVDLIYFIYAGYSATYSQNSTDCIWPKSGTISGGTYDGVSVNRYGVNNELNAYPGAFKKAPYKRCNGIGLFCHEFTHCLGLPDFYATSSSVQKINQTLEYWDLMDSGEYGDNCWTPAAYSAWEREAFGWMTIDTLKSAQNVTLKPVLEGGKAYRIMNDNDPTGHEYYIVENVQKKGWNKSDYGHGMLVYHVDYDANAFSGNYVNNTANHSRMTLIPADSLVLIYYTIGDKNSDGVTITSEMYDESMGGDPFPGTSKNTSLTNTSIVPSVVYTGSFMNKPITEIVEDTLGTDGYASIKFKFMGGVTPDAINNITETESITPQRIYTIDGRYAGTDMSTLPKGIYIRNRKVITK